MSGEKISEQESVKVASDAASDDRESSTIAIVAIIATAVVLMSCMLSCAIIAYAFLNNAPW